MHSGLLTASPVTASVGGTIADSQVAIGNGNTQISTAGGDCIINQAVASPPRPRQAIRVLPRAQPALVGRDHDVALALDTIAQREPVQFHGERGVGKTALLRHVAHAATGACAEGIVYFRAAGTSLDDLRQTLFDFLFECGGPTKRTPGQLASDLAGWEVLFVLDDVGLDEDALEALLDSVPGSTFVLSSAQRTLWSGGESVELSGLSEDAARALFETRLRRALTQAERAAFTLRWHELDGCPQQLVKEAERMRAATRASQRPGAAVPQPTAAGRLTARIAADLDPADRELLALTASLGGVPLHVDHLAELTGRPDAAARLAKLEDRGLAQSHSPRYSATPPVAPLLGAGETARLRARLVAYFIDRAEHRGGDPARLRDDLDPILALLRWGRDAAPHADVLRLARAGDTVAARAGMWDAWRTILEIGLASARAIGDRAGEAWALHQLGTRALCLEQALDAGNMLREALRLRERLGDRAGAANTRHNLRFLEGGGGSPGSSNGVPPTGGGPSGETAAGPGASMLPPLAWPLLSILLPALVLVAGIAMATASRADLQQAHLLDGPSHAVGAKARGAERCHARRCAASIGCSESDSCPVSGAAPKPRRDPRGRRDEPRPPGIRPSDDAQIARASALQPDEAGVATGASQLDGPVVAPAEPDPPDVRVDDPIPAPPLVPPVEPAPPVEPVPPVPVPPDPPRCDDVAAIRTFVRQQLDLPADLSEQDLDRALFERRDEVRQLLKDLCGQIADLIEAVIDPPRL